MGVATTVSNTYGVAIEACSTCARGCWECFEACMSNSNIEPRAKCIKMLVECARECELAAAELASNAMFAKDHCKMCAAVCTICAKDCEMFKEDHCQHCAEVCRECARQCKEIAG